METDVVIIGSGPAGSSAAYRLRDSGLGVVLIERLSDGQFERYHRICGAGVSSHSLKGLDIHQEEILNDVHTLRVRFPGDHSVNLKIKGHIIDRPVLLMRLRREAMEKGVRFIRDSVISIEDNDGYILKLKNSESIHTRYLVGADGAYSVVRKHLFKTTPQIMLKVEEFHSDLKAEEGILDFFMSERYSHFYQWYFPYKDGRCTGAICGCAEKEENATRGARTIPLGWVPEIVRGNAFLVGDSAGMPNPMTAGGLRTAFLSSEAAVRAILKDNPQSYQKWWEHSKMSDRRFSKAQKAFSEMSDEDLAEFARYFTMKGIWRNGFVSFLHHPKQLWLYLGCLMSYRHGW